VLVSGAAGAVGSLVGQIAKIKGCRGGKITEAMFPVFNTKARISICGQVSQYSLARPELGPPLSYLLATQARAEGFLIFQLTERDEEGISQMARWLREGQLKYREEIVEGFESTPRTFVGLLNAENTGKILVKVADVD
jgi:NADPH-dependent curcumin reductase CurA